jgi:hypothetical protein
MCVYLRRVTCSKRSYIVPQGGGGRRLRERLERSSSLRRFAEDKTVCEGSGRQAKGASQGGGKGELGRPPPPKPGKEKLGAFTGNSAGDPGTPKRRRTPYSTEILDSHALRAMQGDTRVVSMVLP